MEIAPISYYTNVKRYWRRRRYQKLSVDNKKRMRVQRLGGGPNGTSPPRRFFKIRKLRFLKFVSSPINLLAKIHGAYVDMMVKMAGNVGGARRIAGGSKKVAKAQDQVSVADTNCGEQAVDTRLVLEIYKRLAASRQLAPLAVEI